MELCRQHECTTRKAQSVAELDHGKVLVTGGYDMSYFASTERYDSAVKDWTGVNNMAEGRAEHTASVMSDGNVLVAGGTLLSGAISNAELYDRTAHDSTTVPEMKERRRTHTASVLANGTVVITGGIVRSINEKLHADVDSHGESNGVSQWNCSPCRESLLVYEPCNG